MAQRLAYIFSALTAVLAIAGCVGIGGIRPPRGSAPIVRTLDTTAYCHCGRCCSWHRTWLGRPVYSSGPLRGKPKAVGITASGTRVRPGTIAADTSIYPFGTIMYVEGYGYGRVEDRGSAIVGNRIDLYYRTHAQAMAWGRQNLRVKIWLPPSPPSLP